MAKTYFVREATGLVREFGAVTALAVGMNNMIGAGIYALSVRAPFRWPGSDIVLAFVMGLFINLAIALVYTWLATAMPRSGADYVFVSRLVNPALSYVVTFGLFVGRLFSIGFLLFTDVSLWGLALFITGRAMRNSGLLNFGSYLLGDATAGVVGGILLLATIYLVLIKGGKLFSYYVVLIWIVPLIGSLLIIGTQVANPFDPTRFKALWDAAWGAGAYDEIVNLAVANGWKKDLLAFNWEQTLLALAGAAMFAYAGFDAPAGIAGEVKRPEKSFYLAIAAGTLITGIVYISLAWSTFYAAGDFISQYNWAFNRARAQIKINPVTDPVIPLFSVVFTGGNPALAFLMAIAGAFSLYHVQPSGVIKDTRRMFAMAFDNFLPRKLAEVSERFHTPVWAISVFLVTGMIGIVISSPVVAAALGPARPIVAAVSATFFYILMAAVAGLAVAILPWARPEIYETIKLEVRGIPLTSLVGVAAFVLSLYFFLLLAIDLYGGGRTALNLQVNVAVYALGALLFVYYASKNARRGIDLKSLFYEVPPE